VKALKEMTALDVKAGKVPANDPWSLSLTSAYIVRYHPVDHPSIPPHCDDNDVTFNLCLGKTFTGTLP
jgi:hypothetical protein